MSSATTLAEAREMTGEIRASGTDVQERRRHGISGGALVDIYQLDELRQITWNEDGSLTIGALVTLAAIVEDPKIQAAYPALVKSAGALATPQIRSMASLGGSLLQRTRCWYYRHHDFTCYKKGADDCPAREGDHRFGSCFDLSACVHPHPSTVGMTLLTYDAQVEINGAEQRPFSAIYGDGSDPTRDHQLPEGEVLTAITLPAATEYEQAAYLRAISRARAEWPLVEVVVRAVVDKQNTITLARVGIGGVAHIPLTLPHVDEILVGQKVTIDVLERAAEAATKGASPLPMTEYKVPLVQQTVLATLLEALEHHL